MDTRGPPHEALFLALSYLPLQQLLSMSQVSKSLRDAINSDVLIWMDLVVERPLHLRLSDDILMMIVSKAQGRLRTLAPLNCFRITDDCLRRVINANPLLAKLYVPGCTALTPEIVLEAAKTLTELKQVKIDGIYNFNKDHLHELQYHLLHISKRRPRFYHKYRNSTFQSLEEDCSSIDVEVCPKCKEAKLVFDCPREACECLGCNNCIPRCESCGICVSGEDEEELGETLCNDALCLDCWLRLQKCDHCNKPFCPRHAEDEQLLLQDYGGSVCENCEMKSMMLDMQYAL